MIDAIGYQYLPKYYGLAGQGVQQAEMSQPVFGQSEAVPAEKTQNAEEVSDSFQTPYERAVKVTGELRKESNVYLAELSKIKSDKLDELLKLHTEISDKCWSNLEGVLAAGNDANAQEIEEIVKDAEAKFKHLIALEKAALGKTDETPADSQPDSSEPRTIAIA